MPELLVKYMKYLYFHSLKINFIHSSLLLAVGCKVKQSIFLTELRNTLIVSITVINRKKYICSDSHLKNGAEVNSLI
jgi:hypothetical protein